MSENERIIELLETISRDLREMKEWNAELAEHLRAARVYRNVDKTASTWDVSAILSYIKDVMGGLSTGTRIERSALYKKVCEKCEENKRAIPTKNMVYRIARRARYGEVRSSGGRYFVS